MGNFRIGGPLEKGQKLLNTVNGTEIARKKVWKILRVQNVAKIARKTAKKLKNFRTNK